MRSESLAVNNRSRRSAEGENIFLRRLICTTHILFFYLPSPNFILLSDVNLVKVEKLEVILGRTFRKENSSSEQIFKVEKYWIHEKFDGETYDNDIGKRSCLRRGF